MKAIVRVCLAGAFTLSSSGLVLGQEAKSDPLAAKLTAALDAAKVVNIAAKDPRGGPRNSDSLLRWDPDPGEGVWPATEETELSC